MKIPGSTLALLACSVSLAAFAQVPFTWSSPSETTDFASGVSLAGTVSGRPVDCDVTRETSGVKLAFLVDGVEVGTPTPRNVTPSPCQLATTGRVAIDSLDLWFGTHTLSAENRGVIAADLPASRQFVVKPQADIVVASGVRVQAGTRSVDQTGWARFATCPILGATSGARAGVPALPPGVPAALVLMHFDISPCDTFFQFDTHPDPTVPLLLAIQLDRDLPANAHVWAYATPPGEKIVRWFQPEVHIEGRRVTALAVQHAALDRGPSTFSGSWGASFAIVVDPAAAPRVDGLYWAGPAENGWGLSLAQHDDRLLGGLFIYDNSGNPRWLVTTGGTWSADHATWTAGLLRPRAMAQIGYKASTFDPGAPVGTITLRTDGKAITRMDAVIDGVAITKPLSRLQFAQSTELAVLPIGGVFWGGASQSGWGVFVTQQGARAFLAWFTYDDAGATKWYFASDMQYGSWREYGSQLLEARSSPWLGTTYDASRLNLFPQAASLFFGPSGGEIDSHVAANLIPVGNTTVIETAIGVVPFPF